MKTYLSAAAAALALLGSTGMTEPTLTESAPADPRVALDEAAPAMLEATEVPSLAVGWIENGEVAWTRVYGERAPGENADDDTLYNIASLTKPIVAETILRLVAEGRLDLDTPLAEQFVDRDLGDDPRAQEITLRDALSHRTGVPQNWRHQMEGGKLRLAWDPGTTAHYSGENYVMAARYAMMATQTRLDHLAKAELFDPIGMHATWFTPDDAWEGRVAMVRGQDGSLRLPDNSPQGSAADDVHTTIGDYTRFVASALRGDGLDSELVAQRGTIYDDQTEKACPEGLIPRDKCPSAAGYGLGWMVYDSGENRFLLHNGKDWGERTIALFEPDKDFGIVIFTSGANGRQVIADVLRLLVRDEALVTLVQAEADYEKAQRD